MFIESKFLEDFDALIFSRRPRSPSEEPLHLFHMVTMKICWEATQFETSRMDFIGRGRTVRNPQVFEDRSPLSGKTGAILDPSFSLRTRVEVEPATSESLSFITGVSKDRAEVERLASRYHELHTVQRAFEMAWSKSNVELRHEQFTVRQAHAFQHLGNAILFDHPGLRADPAVLRENRLTQAGLWRFGISGDFPIVLARVSDPNQVRFVQELLLAHEYLRLRGLRFDLVLLNEYPGGYFQDFQEELENLIRHGYSGHLSDTPGGIYLRVRSQLSHEDAVLLQSVARVVLLGTRKSLEAQVDLDGEMWPEVKERSELFSYLQPDSDPAFLPPDQQWEFANELGGFCDDGRAYSMVLKEGELPPLPWSNVVANKEFGFLVTEAGGGYTWSENSRENRITPWSNDPVSDRPGEVIYIRDAESGKYWCPTPRPVPSDETFLVKHHFGFSEFETQIERIFSKLTISGTVDGKGKFWTLELVNGDYQERILDLYLYLDFTLGVLRDQSGRHLIPTFDSKLGVLQVVNHYNNEFAGRVVFAGASRPIQSYTTDRDEFIGRNRDVSSPRLLEEQMAFNLASLVRGKREEVSLSNKIQVGSGPSGILHLKVTIEPGATETVHFFLGEEENGEVVVEQAKQYQRSDFPSESLTQVRNFWQELTTAVQVRTPDRSLDIMLNGWLMYQTLSCRIFGRSAFYQSGGAFGFRDQLQDVLMLLEVEPSRVREQILLHASRQFLEGDVQHWWHPPTGRGVRTRISDDYLWLPYVVARYLEFTEDLSILDEPVGFLEAEQLPAHEMEAYIVPHVSQHSSSIYEHCIIAIDRALRFGSHGVPLIGGGDWNDGMNEVGREGKGESVWLGWFLLDILNSFVDIVRVRNDNYRADSYTEHVQKLRESIEQNCWDGEWYYRGFFDDGSPLGSSKSKECQIDSLSQSWAVITGAGDPKRCEIALKEAYRYLVREEERIICLLTPPFDDSDQEPGYIKGYLPGTRENGGQYTHAAAWLIMASALMGWGERAHSLWNMINPVNLGSTAEGVGSYMGEPYVTCGDVYSASPHGGRAGWSWYTGSAGWLYQVGLRSILGLQIAGERITIDPCIPSDWREYTIRFSHKERDFECTIQNPNGVERGVSALLLDGKKLPQNSFCVSDLNVPPGETIRVSVQLGKQGEAKL